MVPVFRTGSPDSASSPRPRFGLHAIARSNSERTTAFVVDRRRQAAAALAMSRSSGLLTRGTTEAGPCCPSGLRPSTRQQQGYSVCASLSARFERSRRPDAPGDRTVAIGESGQKMGFCRASRSDAPALGVQWAVTAQFMPIGGPRIQHETQHLRGLCIGAPGFEPGDLTDPNYGRQPGLGTEIAAHPALRFRVLVRGKSRILRWISGD
jgi:hypothetical protein